MKKEPKKIRLNPESPTSKEVKKIPLTSIYDDLHWDLANTEKIIIGMDNENYKQNNSEGVSTLDSDTIN